jgi:ATP-dependent Lon protease
MTTLLRLPFGKYKSLPVSLESNTIEECSDFISSAKETLDAAVFGMTEVKEQIYQLIGQWVSNPDSIGTSIAIEGPMGTGKTTLVREGISKALGRDFIFMALGGATDSSFLEGHSYTYEGAKHGKIVDGLTTCTSMNPVFFFDELDKVSDTPRGQEIIGVLTHLTDSSQNMEFHDKYFAELSFDLSRALFVFSYNDRNMISPILRDRMHKLCTRGYTPPEKISISRGYLLPSIRERVRFDESMISIPDDVIQHIVDKHTQKEKGVRNLGRCLGIIYTKVNLARLVHDTSRFMKSDVLKDLTVPLTLTMDQADALLGAKSEVESWRHMYM